MDEPLKALQTLGSEFERLAHRRRRRLRLPVRTSLLAVVAGASLSAGALAASGVLTGEPVKDPPGPKPTADAGAGLLRSSSARLTALRVADPDGGPPWGLRTLRTTRELGCIQIGRVLGGQLGALGQDGAFGDDRRFHPKGPEVQTGRDCQTLDGAGRLFAAVSYQGLPASGLGDGCTVQPPQKLELTRGAPAPADPLPQCPAGDVRILFYGTLGPQARSVSYRARDGELRTVRTSGPDGAYLIVQRPSKQRPAKGYSVPSTSPVSGLTRITYRDGSVCRLRDPRSIGGGKPCPRVGYVEPAHAAISAANVKAPVTATVSPRPITPPSIPGAAEPPKLYAVKIAFTAPVAAGPRSQYLITMKVTHPSRCGNTGGSGGPIGRNVRAGERVEEITYLSANCHSSVTGEVRYRQQTANSERDPFGLGPGVLMVGRFKLDIGGKP